MGLFELILALSCLGALERIIHHVTKPKMPKLSNPLQLQLNEIQERIVTLEAIAVGVDPLSKEIEALPEPERKAI